MLHFEVDIAGQAEKLAEEYLLPTAAAFLADLFAAVAAAKVHLFLAHSWFGFETSPLLVEVHKEPLFEATATLDCTVGYLVIDRLFAFPHYIH